LRFAGGGPWFVRLVLVTLVTGMVVTLGPVRSAGRVLGRLIFAAPGSPSAGRVGWCR
jgi:hypothetical protein